MFFNPGVEEAIRVSPCAKAGGVEDVVWTLCAGDCILYDYVYCYLGRRDRFASYLCLIADSADHTDITAAIDKFTFTPLSVYNLIGPPSAKSFFGIILFILASGVQHDCHVYLASLKKYTLPVHGTFEYLVCPHYFAECLIYLALAILSAPRGRGAVLNSTLVTGLVFVGVNLGCTSLLSREWYEDKFGRHSVERKSPSLSLFALVSGISY